MFLNDDELNYKLGSIQNVGDVIDIFANLHILKDKSKIDEIYSLIVIWIPWQCLEFLRI